jgi:hypothetical protein
MISGGLPKNFCSECARKAWEASWPLANTRAWLSYGVVSLLVGAVALITTQKSWWSVVLTVSALMVTWAILFVVEFFKAGPRLYYTERDRAELLSERLRPKMEIGLNKVSGGIRKERTWHAGEPGPASKWVQFDVTPIGDSPLIDCEARLTRVTRLLEGEGTTTILDEPLWCVWSNTNSTSIRIPAKVTHAANIFSLHDGTNKLMPQTEPENIGFRSSVQLPGTYRLNVSISARDVPTQRVAFLLAWGGSFESINLRMGY